MGFVPTMGALHAGHLELVSRARQGNDVVVVSIFVNPTQFNNPEDLTKYPRDLAGDLAKLANADFVFLPKYEEIYRDQYRYRVSEHDGSEKLCGKSRPGHFTGVLTVVMKLFQLVQPHNAYFGEKDFQQLSLIRGMAEAFFLPIHIHGVPTVREASGLAMSSRNERLSTEARAHAAKLPHILMEAPTANAAALKLQQEGFTVDYVEDWNGRRFAAVFLEGVRLIDNVSLATATGLTALDGSSL